MSTMLKNVTRLGLIEVWFTAVGLAVVTGFGATVTVGTGVMLFALSLVPPAIVLLLWPRVQPLTVSEELHGADRSA